LTFRHIKSSCCMFPFLFKEQREAKAADRGYVFDSGQKGCDGGVEEEERINERYHTIH